MHFLPGIPNEFLLGALSNILYYWCEGKLLYSGTTKILPTDSPSLWHSSHIYWHAISISSSPVKNNNMSPSVSFLWIYITESIAAFK